MAILIAWLSSLCLGALADWKEFEETFSKASLPSASASYEGWWRGRCWTEGDDTAQAHAGLLVYRRGRRDSLFVITADPQDYWDAWNEMKKAELAEGISKLPIEYFNNVFERYGARVGFVHYWEQYFMRQLGSDLWWRERWAGFRVVRTISTCSASLRIKPPLRDKEEVPCSGPPLQQPIHQRQGPRSLTIYRSRNRLTESSWFLASIRPLSKSAWM